MPIRKALPDRYAVDPPARGRVKLSRYVQMAPKLHDLHGRDEVDLGLHGTR